jgi:hypothetical protein
LRAIRRIRIVRGERVIIDSDLARLYGVATKVLLQAVRRNRTRFPDDFMFQLTRSEHESLRSQFVTLEIGRGRHRKYLPFVFTEQGVAMLASVLRSPRAILVNIEIVRAFVRMRAMLGEHATLARRIGELERKYDRQFKVVFDAIRRLIEPTRRSRRKIGFKAPGSR